MFIHDMTEAECLWALKKASVGRLACARDNQPYIVPVYFACHERHLYAISTVGQKIEWMRANPLVCVEVDELTSYDEWMSVVVFGRYEELPDLPQFKRAREQALSLLQRRSNWWWEPACACESYRDSAHSCTPVSYRIHIDHVSGHHATPNHTAVPRSNRKQHPTKSGWLSHLFGGSEERQSNGRSLS